MHFATYICWVHVKYFSMTLTGLQLIYQYFSRQDNITSHTSPSRHKTVMAYCCAVILQFVIFDIIWPEKSLDWISVDMDYFP